ncbi:hypothetical protein Tco_0053910 [Tanacetum coccineum]
MRPHPSLEVKRGLGDYPFRGTCKKSGTYLLTTLSTSAFACYTKYYNVTPLNDSYTLTDVNSPEELMLTLMNANSPKSATYPEIANSPESANSPKSANSLESANSPSADSPKCKLTCQLSRRYLNSPDESPNSLDEYPNSPHEYPNSPDDYLNSPSTFSNKQQP